MKKWYRSKTIWINLILLAGIIAQAITGKDTIAVELAQAETAILVVINLILRLITKQKLQK